MYFWLVHMATQTQIAEHLGITQQAVSKTLEKMGIVEWQGMTLDDIRLLYIKRLREAAAGRNSADGQYDLQKERALTERVDRELKLYALAEKKGELVNVETLMNELTLVFQGMKQELLSRDDKLKTELDTLYGVDIDVTILNEHTTNVLSHLSRYIAGRADSVAQTGAVDAAAAQDGNNAVG